MFNPAYATGVKKIIVVKRVVVPSKKKTDIPRTTVTSAPTARRSSPPRDPNAHDAHALGQCESSARQLESSAVYTGPSLLNAAELKESLVQQGAPTELPTREVEMDATRALGDAGSNSNGEVKVGVDPPPPPGETPETPQQVEKEQESLPTPGTLSTEAAPPNAAPPSQVEVKQEVKMEPLDDPTFIPWSSLTKPARDQLEVLLHMGHPRDEAFRAVSHCIDNDIDFSQILDILDHLRLQDQGSMNKTDEVVAPAGECDQTWGNTVGDGRDGWDFNSPSKNDQWGYAYGYGDWNGSWSSQNWWNWSRSSWNAWYWKGSSTATDIASNLNSPNEAHLEALLNRLDTADIEDQSKHGPGEGTSAEKSAEGSSEPTGMAAAGEKTDNIDDKKAKADGPVEEPEKKEEVEAESRRVWGEHRA